MVIKRLCLRTLALYTVAAWIGLRAGWWFGCTVADTFMAINRNAGRTAAQAWEAWSE